MQSDTLEGSVTGDGISCLSWSADGSQIAAGTATGRIQTFYLIREYAATLFYWFIHST